MGRKIIRHCAEVIWPAVWITSVVFDYWVHQIMVIKIIQLANGWYQCEARALPLAVDSLHPTLEEAYRHIAQYDYRGGPKIELPAGVKIKALRRNTGFPEGE